MSNVRAYEMSDLRERIKAIAFARARRGHELEDLLEPNDDLTIVVLRGHLVLEELLFTAVSSHCREPEHLKLARLRFPQLVSLLRALERDPSVPPAYWEALGQLNTLRNALAHNLEPSDLAARVQNFVAIVASAGVTPSSPTDSREALEAAILSLVISMNFVGTIQAVFEEAIRHRSKNENEGSDMP
jgi:hypothetical protein